MIKITNATKQYKETTALDGINLQIDESGIYCLLGRNGAGKTTLLKSLAGHINLTAGEIEVNGKRVSTLSMPNSINFIEAQGKLFNLQIKDLIKYSAKLSGDFDKEFALAAAKKFNLDINKKYNHLSFGMKTMVTTLLSISGNAKIVLLDEPVLGLDAIMRDEFYTLLQESMEAHPRIIIVSTHLIDEIARVAEKIIIIEKAKILDYLTSVEIDEKGYVITGTSDAVEKAIKGLRVINRKITGTFTSATIFDKRIKQPAGCVIAPIGLQDYFIALIGGNK